MKPKEVSVIYKNQKEMLVCINLMEKKGWRVLNIEKVSYKRLGCTGCCILPFPLFWYKDFSDPREVKYKKDENNDEVALEQEFDARRYKD